MDGDLLTLIENLADATRMLAIGLNIAKEDRTELMVFVLRVEELIVQARREGWAPKCEWEEP